VLLLIAAAGILLLGRAGWDDLLPTQSGPSPNAVQSRPTDSPPSAKPQPNEVAVEVTEAELNGRLGQQFAGRAMGQTPLGPATLDRVQVSLQSERASLNGTARVGDASLPFTSQVAAAPDAAGGVKVQVTEARVSGVPLPEAARAEMEAAMQREVDRLLSTQRMRVRTVEIGAGRLRAVGSPLG
jgi:hypothetical protein